MWDEMYEVLDNSDMWRKSKWMMNGEMLRIFSGKTNKTDQAPASAGMRKATGFKREQTEFPMLSSQ